MANTTINVRMTDGTRHDFTLNTRTTTVGALKTLLATLSNVATTEQRLFWARREMEDDKTLSFYGVDASADVRLKEWNYDDLRIRKGEVVHGTFDESTTSDSSSDD